MTTHLVAHSLQDTETGSERGWGRCATCVGLAMLGPRAVCLNGGCVGPALPHGVGGEGVPESKRVLGCHGGVTRKDQDRVKSSHDHLHQCPAAKCNSSHCGGHLRAISKSSGCSVLSFCMAMSVMGPRITTGRLKLAGGRRQSSSGGLGAGTAPGLRTLGGSRQPDTHLPSEPPSHMGGSGPAL